MRYIVIGTAGHIDHGKTALVRKITGMETDRLKEEKDRGISIVLGFAYKKISDANILAFVDVPGHKKFIKTMVAGVCGIDYAMLVIAADEGIMPQTEEHLAILQILGIQDGCVVITKCDAVNETKILESKITSFTQGTFLEGKPLFKVSSVTGDGIDSLVAHLQSFSVSVRDDTLGAFRLPADRSFAVKGFGTVVTGTVFNGTICQGSEVYVYPAGKTARIRKMEVHETPMETVSRGMRVALNLSGIEHNDVPRGSVVMNIKREAVREVHALLHLLPSGYGVSHSETIQMSIATEETEARVLLLNDQKEAHPGSSVPVLLKLSRPLIIARNDKFVFMKNNFTSGGGIIVDTHPPRYKKNSEMILNGFHIMAAGDIQNMAGWKLERAHMAGYFAGKLSEFLDVSEPHLIQFLKSAKTFQSFDTDRGMYYIGNDAIAQVKKRCADIVELYHRENPMRAGISVSDLKGKISADMPQSVFDSLLGSMSECVLSGRIVSQKGFSAQFSGPDAQIAGQVVSAVSNNGYAPPTVAEMEKTFSCQRFHLQKILCSLCEQGILVRVNEDVYISAQNFEKLVAAVKDYYKSHSGMEISDFKNIVNVSRKYALPLIEMLDNKNITLRRENIRYLKK